MTDWLEEIEARANALVVQTVPLLPGEGAHTEYQYLVKDVCDDSARLIARVHELAERLGVMDRMAAMLSNKVADLCAERDAKS